MRDDKANRVGGTNWHPCLCLSFPYWGLSPWRPVGIPHPENSGVTATWCQHALYLKVHSLGVALILPPQQTPDLVYPNWAQAARGCCSENSFGEQSYGQSKSQPDFDNLETPGTLRQRAKGGRIKIGWRISVEIYWIHTKPRKSAKQIADTQNISKEGLDLLKKHPFLISKDRYSTHNLFSLRH